MKVQTNDESLQEVLNRLCLAQRNWINTRQDNQVDLAWANTVQVAAMELALSNQACIEAGVPANILDIARRCFLEFVPIVFNGHIYAVNIDQSIDQIVFIDQHWMEVITNEQGVVTSIQQKKISGNEHAIIKVALCLSKGVQA